MPKFSWRGEEQGSKSPSSLLFEPISPSSLNVYLTFSPSSLLFPPVSPSSLPFSPTSPSSQLFLGHFSLLPILFLLPPSSWSHIFSYWLVHGELWVISVLCAANNGFFLLHMELKLPMLLMEHTIHKSRHSKLTADIILNWPFPIYLNSAG